MQALFGLGLAVVGYYGYKVYTTYKLQNLTDELKKKLTNRNIDFNNINVTDYTPEEYYKALRCLEISYATDNMMKIYNKYNCKENNNVKYDNVLPYLVKLEMSDIPALLGDLCNITNELLDDNYEVNENTNDVSLKLVNILKKQIVKELKVQREEDMKQLREMKKEMEKLVGSFVVSKVDDVKEPVIDEKVTSTMESLADVDNELLKVNDVDNELLKVNDVDNELLKVNDVDNELLKVNDVDNELLKVNDVDNVDNELLKVAETLTLPILDLPIIDHPDTPRPL
jgi:hypothetical protein